MSQITIPSWLYDDEEAGESEESRFQGSAILSAKDLVDADQQNTNAMTQAARAKRMLVPNLNVDGTRGTRYQFAQIPTLVSKFAHPERMNRKNTSRIDWPDTNMFNRPGIKLIRLRQSSRIELGKRVISDLHTGISEQTIGSIFILAWNICHDLKGNRVYPGRDPTSTNRDIEFNDLSTYPEQQTEYPLNVDYRGSDAIVAEGLAFFCGSLFRLFTKSTENYVAAWDAIKRTFLSFYDTSFPILNFRPNADMITNVKTMINSIESYRNTLTGFLMTEHTLDSNSSGIRNFLHEIHLAFTGMHCFTLFVRIVDKLKISPLDMLTAVFHPRTEDAAKEIADVWVLYNREEIPEDYKRGTWRFARIFSPRYFANIHSRKCPELIVIFSAMVAQLEGQENRNNNVFKIAHTKSMAPDTFEKYKEIGTKLYVHFRSLKRSWVEEEGRSRGGQNKRRRTEESQSEDDDEEAMPEVQSDFDEDE